jgi:hypothetical protein
LKLFPDAPTRESRHPVRIHGPHLLCGGLVLVLALALPALAAPTTAGAILAAPDRYDGQPVTLQGALTHLSKRVSQRGNPYYTFDLQEKVKRVGRYTFFNEITATRIMCR